MQKYINNNSDEAILSLIHHRKEEGMKKLIDQYFTEFFQYAIKLTGDEEETKDIIQTVFLDFWELKQVNKIKNLKGYLFKMIKSQVFKLWSQRKNINELLERYNEINYCKQQDASAKIEFDEFNSEVQKIIDLLPNSCRHIFELSKFEELPLDVIASRLNISKQTVKNQLTKANAILRNQFVKKKMLI